MPKLAEMYRYVTVTLAVCAGCLGEDMEAFFGLPPLPICLGKQCAVRHNVQAESRANLVRMAGKLGDPVPK